VGHRLDRPAMAFEGVAVLFITGVMWLVAHFGLRDVSEFLDFKDMERERTGQQVS
jgi:hypothetical protein